LPKRWVLSNRQRRIQRPAGKTSPPSGARRKTLPAGPADRMLALRRIIRTDKLSYGAVQQHYRGIRPPPLAPRLRGQNTPALPTRTSLSGNHTPVPRAGIGPPGGRLDTIANHFTPGCDRRSGTLLTGQVPGLLPWDLATPPHLPLKVSSQPIDSLWPQAKRACREGRFLPIPLRRGTGRCSRPAAPCGRNPPFTVLVPPP
jgi:hypothetical protein